jgi:hypothetical protein
MPVSMSLPLSTLIERRSASNVKSSLDGASSLRPARMSRNIQQGLIAVSMGRSSSALAFKRGANSYQRTMLDSPIILPSTLASFLLTSFLIEMTPGPDMTYLALVSASDGRRAGFATVSGVAIGLAVVGAIAAIGVAEFDPGINSALRGVALGRRSFPAVSGLGWLDDAEY